MALYDAADTFLSAGSLQSSDDAAGHVTPIKAAREALRLKVARRRAATHPGRPLHTYGRFAVGDHVKTPTLRRDGIRTGRITAIEICGKQVVFIVVDDLFHDTHELRFEELDG